MKRYLVSSIVVGILIISLMSVIAFAGMMGTGSSNNMTGTHGSMMGTGSSNSVTGTHGSMMGTGSSNSTTGQ